MFSTLLRPKMKQQAAEFRFDVLVIGGGVTGAGIALDAVTRGMSVLLVEMQDFAEGTSSRSTKLIHGGLRYLKQMELKIVAETGRERKVVFENAPHVTEPERMLLPFYKGGTFGPFMTSAGLAVYDRLAGVDKDERRKMLSPEETLSLEPLLNQEGLLGGGHYVEYRTDDARLTIEVLKKAAEKGAVCLNYCKAESFVYEGGRVSGAWIRDMFDGSVFRADAGHVVNAAGPWVDTVRQLDGKGNNKHLKLSKGAHIVVDQSRFPLRQAIYFDSQDGRMIFAIPRGGKAYVGTTDTFYEGDPGEVLASEEDIRYLIEAANGIFPDVRLHRGDVESAWAGVRPLIHQEGKDPSEISRKDEIWESDSGLLTIAGGKLTGYRKMAEHVVDQIAERRPSGGWGPCVTKHLPLSGGDFARPEDLPRFIEGKANEAELYGLTREEGREIAAFYGTNADAVFKFAHAAGEGDGLSPADRGRILYSIHEEMAACPADFLVRRTGWMFFDVEKAKKIGGQTADYMNRMLGKAAVRKGGSNGPARLPGGTDVTEG
ncbi:glycerol-3-phosphate dehydrogenase/oxidase [Edaphobacillus lindanitolerans]|uniref:Glycerol-3-phosphate dehydrogenase n=1 Tax=Edaphobacillus lindanitolerans TaxID=550447 RepID=A0A1U7PHE0_9BACI|nr:glycerol-3-phosphate dehydrogenase/oxidase [Edaphobacillus lindanitolerans]SIT66985.1 homodimeric glycerol 3-phosphate dehydrogenase (quinone) [Edaphobacillus lindanitolerans]